MAQNQKLVFTVVVVLHKKKAMIMICSWRTNLNIIRLAKKVHLVLSKIKGMFFIFTKKFIEQLTTLIKWTFWPTQCKAANFHQTNAFNITKSKSLLISFLYFINLNIYMYVYTYIYICPNCFNHIVILLSRRKHGENTDLFFSNKFCWLPG